MHRPVSVAHSSFVEGLHTTKNTASGCFRVNLEAKFLVVWDPLMNELDISCE